MSNNNTLTLSHARADEEEQQPDWFGTTATSAAGMVANIGWIGGLVLSIITIISFGLNVYASIQVTKSLPKENTVARTHAVGLMAASWVMMATPGVNLVLAISFVYFAHKANKA